MGSAGVKMPVALNDHVVFPAVAGVWIEVDEERLLVCAVRDLPSTLEELSDCPLCHGEGPAEVTRAVCGRTAGGVPRPE